MAGREVRYLVTLIEPESGKVEQRMLDAIKMIKGVQNVEVIWPTAEIAAGLRAALAGREFYDLMQAYRTAPIVPFAAAGERFEDVRNYIFTCASALELAAKGEASR